MCVHREIRAIAARSGEWWWCQECGMLRDPEGRWHRHAGSPRVLVAPPPDPSAGVLGPRPPSTLPAQPEPGPEWTPPRAAHD